MGRLGVMGSLAVAAGVGWLLNVTIHNDIVTIGGAVIVFLVVLWFAVQ